MLSEHTPMLTASALEDESYTWFSPLPVIALCSRIHFLLETYRLAIHLQRLEVADYDDESQAQHVVVVTKLRGTLDGSHLQRQFKLLLQNYDRDRRLSITDEQRRLDTLDALPLSLINLTELSVAEQRDQIDKYISESILSCQGVVPHSQMHTYAVHLHMDVHLFLVNLWHYTPATYTPPKLMQVLFDIFSGQKHRSAIADAGSPDQDGDKGMLLTVRELEMLRHISEGCSNREIAGRCCIAEGTVKRHLSNIYIKLDANSRTQAIARAQSLKLLAPMEHER